MTYDNDFEVLDMLRNRYADIKDLYDGLKFSLTDEEIAKFSKLLKRINRDIEDMTQQCYDKDICPECGGDMYTKTWVEDTCGYVSCHYCAECGHKEDN